MKTVLIGKDVTLGDGTSTTLDISNVNSLTDGALSIYTKAGRKANTTAILGTTYPNEPVMVYVGGSGVSGLVKSPIMDREQIDYKFLPYLAPTKKQIAIGNDATATGMSNALS